MSVLVALTRRCPRHSPSSVVECCGLRPPRPTSWQAAALNAAGRAGKPLGLGMLRGGPLRTPLPGISPVPSIRFGADASARDKLHSPAAERNKEPIVEVLKQYISNRKRKEEEEINLLEIASGTGQHVVHFAKHFPEIQFQPSECEENYRRSIAAYISDSGVQNVRDPIIIDIRTPYTTWASGAFKENSVSFVVNINMIHITEIECTEHLFMNVQKILKPGGILFMYGPFAFNGVITPESNVRFDKSLREENPGWGLRDVEDLKVLGSKNGLELIATHALPANNHVLVWKKK